MLHAKVMNGQIVEEREFADTPPDTTRKGFQWLPYVDTNPPFDSATQVKTGPVVTIEATQVTRVWSVRAKTAQEIDDIKEGIVSEIAFLMFELAFDHENRVRVLEAKAPITRAAFRNALKARLP